MNENVKIVTDESGNVIRQSSNPEWGYVVLRQRRIAIDAEGFAKMQSLQGIMPGKMEDLIEFNLDANSELPGKLVVKEQLRPFNYKNPTKDLKIAGDSRVPCTVNGDPIYRRIVYTTDLNSSDVYIQHDNKAEIRAGKLIDSKIISDELLD